MKIVMTKIDPKDLIYQFTPASYEETYAGTFVSKKEVTPDDLMIDFWTEMPGWVAFLFKIRNWMVRPFGLKNEDQDENRNAKLAECIRTGGEYKITRVVAKSEDETVICLSDKHLDAYMSVRIEKAERGNRLLKLSTLVKFHNRLGRIYFGVISPFHHLIVRSKLKQTLKKLANQS